jgi:hypothetical protein
MGIEVLVAAFGVLDHLGRKEAVVQLANGYLTRVLGQD